MIGSFFSKLKQGLSKTSSNLTSSITQLFTHKRLDEDTLEQFYDILIMSDIGVKTTEHIIYELKKNKFNKEVSPEEIKFFLKDVITDIIQNKVESMNIQKSPHVIMVCGVNGNGKTTTTAKLANYYQNQGKKVLVAACDTFRAGAVDQLVEWCERISCPVIKGDDNLKDPAAVAFKAMQNAVDYQYDLLIIDTAGRLHTHHNLMQELEKIKNVIAKIQNNSPDDIILVLDGTTGQNALQQLAEFKKITNVNGIIVTKLDGTTKAGVIVALAKEFDVKIRAVGVGEKIDDLQPFSAEEFCKSILDI